LKNTLNRRIRGTADPVTSTDRVPIRTSLMRALSVLLGIAVLSLAGCSDHRTYDSRGRVISIATDLQSVVVDHEDIPGLMPAMTMRLRVMDQYELDHIAVGDAISFRLHVTSETSWIDRLVVLDADAIDGLPSQPAIRSTGDQTLVMPGGVVPEWELVRETGETITGTDLSGAPYLITFIYTRCPLPDYCPLMSRRFRAIQDSLVAESSLTKLVSVSVDPTFDAPEVMAEYGYRVGADPSIWWMATGNPEQVSHVATIFGVFYSEENGEINHNLSTVLVDADGRVRRIWRGNEWTVAEVVETRRRLEDVETGRRSS
jgi:protein SCO1